MTTFIIDTIHSHTIQPTNNSRFLGSPSRDGLSLLVWCMTTIIYAISHVKVAHKYDTTILKNYYMYSSFSMIFYKITQRRP